MLGSQRAHSQLSNEWSHRRATMPASEVMPELKCMSSPNLCFPLQSSVHWWAIHWSSNEIEFWRFQFGHNFRYRHRSPTMRPLIGKLRTRSLWSQQRMLSIVIQIHRDSTSFWWRGVGALYTMCSDKRTQKRSGWLNRCLVHRILPCFMSRCVETIQGLSFYPYSYFQNEVKTALPLEGSTMFSCEIKVSAWIKIVTNTVVWLVQKKFFKKLITSTRKWHSAYISPSHISKIN